MFSYSEAPLWQVGGHRPCGNCDTAAKIVYVNFEDHVIKGSDGFIEGNSSLHIPNLLKLTAIEIVLMDIYNSSRDITRPRDYIVI